MCCYSRIKGTQMPASSPHDYCSSQHSKWPYLNQTSLSALQPHPLFSLPRALASFTTHNLVLPGFFAQYSLIFFLLLQLFLPFSLSSPAHVVFVSLA